jgi:excisionase family DNA binding protein
VLDYDSVRETLVRIPLRPMNDDHFLTTEEVLDYLKVNLRTVYRLIKAGKIPAVRVGRQWRFRKRDIDAWLDSSRQTSHAAAGKQGVNGERPRILVVDDEQAVRDLLAKTLTMADYDVDSAPDGASAIDRLRAVEYDLLITDLKMPGMDGLSVIREARRAAPDLPVIIITGYSTEASAIEAINLGVAGYLTKPFRLPRILAATARALGEPVPAAET